MARDDDRTSGTPSTLADLWLRNQPARRPDATPSPKSTPKPAPSSSAPQLDLLFAAPEPSVSAPPAPELPVLPESPRRIFSVAELVSGIRGRLEHDYADVLVEGEISNCRPAASGHIYLTLKDGDAQLPVVLFRRQAQLLRFRPQNGLAVLARGRISVYEQRGQLQLIAESLEPLGAGALQLAFEQLKARLLAEGLFDTARKRPLPAFPRCVGVITSTSGAVLHDIIKVTRRRHARLNLLVFPAAVQGPNCASSVIAGIRFFNAHPGRADLILIARGGGSPEDLAGFNDEALARAIAASALPVVSAVGHETDFTIADFVADLRAPTPSAAAEIVTAAQHQIEDRLAALHSRVLRAARYHLVLARQRLTAVSVPAMRARLESLLGRRAQRLDDLSYRLEAAASRRIRTRSSQLAQLTARLARHNPAARLAHSRRRLDHANHSLARLAQTLLATRAARLDRAAARLHALSPLAVLDRGYALVYAPDGTLLRTAATVRPNDSIDVRLAQGGLVAKVTKIAEE
ncbi:MAG TPA: exodeoxyribonuclease VII large subunit [Acidobacteriaceae bacterium]|nr:exodeoxyribonuclease VII large subunit [Acidobacteriaceae bacterium]